MVLDAQIKLTLMNNLLQTEEVLYPDRHQITLPINGLNILFDDCTVAFNHHTKLSSDRYGYVSVKNYIMSSQKKLLFRF